MRILSGIEEQEAKRSMERAAESARAATCQRARCGAVIVKAGEIIGEGCNTPPANDEGQRRCQNQKTAYHQKVTDKTCCIHAEERAIMAALRKYPENLAGATLYFIRLDQEGKKMFAGKPYCTICSKMALDTGIAEFVLWQAGGITSYPTAEYNQLSFEYEGNDASLFDRVS